MSRSFFALCVVVAVCGRVSAAPVPPAVPDPLPKGATARLGTPHFRGPHTGGLTFSPDGKRLLAFSDTSGRAEKQSLRTWDADTGMVLSSKFGTPANLDRFFWVGSVLAGERVVWLCQQALGATKPSEIVVADLAGKVQNRIEIEGRALLYVSPFPGSFYPSAVSDDGAFAVVSLDNGRAFAVYDLTSGKKLLTEKFDVVDQPTTLFAQDRKTLFVRSRGKSIRRFELPSGKELAPLEGTTPASDKLFFSVDKVAGSPDGKLIVTQPALVTKVVDGKALVEQPKALKVYDGKTGKQVGEIGAGPMVMGFVFADADNLLVSVQVLRPLQPPKLVFEKWNATTRKRVWDAPATGHSLAVAPDGKRFVSAGPSQLFLHSAADGKLLVDAGGHPSFVTWIGFSPDGKTVTTAGGPDVMSWELNGRRKSRVSVPELHTSALHIASTVSDHLTWFATTHEETPKPMLFGWDSEKNAIGWKIPVEQPRGWVFTPDGKHLVSVRGDPAKADNIVAVHDISTGKSLREWSYQRPAGSHAPFSGPHRVCGGGRFVATAEIGVIKLFDARTGKEFAAVKHTFDKPPATWTPNIEAAASGEKLAVIEQFKTVTIYEVKSGKLLARHSFPQATANGTRFSPDGNRLAVWSVRGEGEAGAVAVWDLETPDVKPRTFVAEAWSVATCVAFSPNGATLAVGYQDGTALLWDLTAK